MTRLYLKEFEVSGLMPFQLDIQGACICCLSGPSGAGKSLLLRAMNDLIVHKGEACLDEQKCSETNPVQWRKWVGLLPAESAWWMDKVGDHFIEKQSDYLQQLNLPADCFSWDLIRCSSGEKQRLALARLLELQPRILLLDEPTASLDPESVLNLESIIKMYAAEYQTPVIWVSHDREQVKRIADRSFKIVNNKIIEQGL